MLLTPDRKDGQKGQQEYTTDKYSYLAAFRNVYYFEK
jgi:hypothetical protein